MLTPEQIAFVRAPHIAVLATVGDDGEPHAAPMWYAFDGSRFEMVTRNGSRKHRNLEQHPRVTVVIDKRTRPYYALMVQCVADFSREGVELVRSRIAARYVEEPELSTYLDSRRESDSIVVRLEPVDVAVYGAPPA